MDQRGMARSSGHRRMSQTLRSPVGSVTQVTRFMEMAG